jgi:hypothetical protein
MWNKMKGWCEQADLSVHDHANNQRVQQCKVCRNLYIGPDDDKLQLHVHLFSSKVKLKKIPYIYMYVVACCTLIFHF